MAKLMGIERIIANTLLLPDPVRLKRDLVASARILERLADGFASGTYRPHAIGCALPHEDARQAYEQFRRDAAAVWC